MNAIQYLVQVNFYLILFYGFYRILLRNETFHGSNRLFLMGGAGLSLGIPMLQSEWVQSLFITEKVNEAVVFYMAPMRNIIITPQQKQFTWSDLSLLIYVSGSVFFSIKFIINILNLRKLLINGVQAFRAFTFGKRIYIDHSMPESQTVLKHETVHAAQLHSFDVVFFEILLIINWFNPVLYAYRQSIKNIHEFLADEVAATELGKARYARLLLSQEFGVSPSVFTTSFFDQSSLKQRIIMLAKPKSKKTALLKYGLTMPLFIAMLIVSSAFVANSEVVSKVSSLAQSKNSILETIQKPVSASTFQLKIEEGIIYIYDGKEISLGDLRKLDSKLIKTMVRLKKEESIKLYGERANGGVVMLSSKINDFTELTSEQRNLVMNSVVGFKDIKMIENLSVIGKETSDNVKTDVVIDLALKSEESTEEVPTQIIIQNAENQGLENAHYVLIQDDKVTEINKNLLSNFDPNSIESVTVLPWKDARSKYGQKGENGVVEINLKTKTKYNVLDEIVVVAPEMPQALYILDGKEITDINKIKPEIIDKMVVLKAPEALKKYGEKGKNGAMEITSKIKFGTFDNQEEVFGTVEEMASFPGGIKELYRFLGMNIKYPETAHRAKVEGKVFLDFIVQKDGVIKEIRILKGIGFGCDEEAKRVVGIMPKWIPGKQNGINVNQRYTLPISFKIEK